MCNVCGDDLGPEATPEEMMTHYVFEHPIELLQNRRVQRTITSAAYDLGKSLAEWLKGKR